MNEINDDEPQSRLDAISDDQLQARFSSLRQYDARGKPEFGAMLDHTRSQRHTIAPGVAPGLRWVAAAACMVIAAALLVAKTRDRSSSATARTPLPAISGWQSPTAALLDAPVHDLMAPPPVLSSVFDGVIAPLQIDRLTTTSGD